MYPVLALLLAVLGVFTVVALSDRGRALPMGLLDRLRAPGRRISAAVSPLAEQDPSRWPPPSGPARETLDGFALVGGSGLLIVAVAVVVIGVVTPDNGIADLVAMIAFFAYLIFVAVALVLARRAR